MTFVLIVVLVLLGVVVVGLVNERAARRDARPAPLESGRGPEPRAREAIRRVIERRQR